MTSGLDRLSSKVRKGSATPDEKRYVLFRKLETQEVDRLKEFEINLFDLNILDDMFDATEIDIRVSPLIYAAFFGLKQIVRLLLRNKCVDVDMETQNTKQTPLLTACLAGNYEVVRLLLLAKAEPNKPNALNQSPLAITLLRIMKDPYSFENRKICFMIAKMLVNYGADPNWIINKKKGFSLLHHFCSIHQDMDPQSKRVNYEIIRLLLQKGANPYQLTLEDQSCEQLLEDHCNKNQLIRLLESYKSKEPTFFPFYSNIKRIDADFFRIPSK